MECGLNTVTDEKLLESLLFLKIIKRLPASDDINFLHLPTLNKEFLYTLYNYAHIQYIKHVFRFY